MSIRRTPFEEMNRMFDLMHRSMFDDRHWEGSHGTSQSDANLNVETDDDGYVIVADLPGVEREELDLRFDDGLLTITGEHETTERSETAASTRSRRVHEQVRLPGDVDADGIEATYRNGVLEVRVPTDEPVDEGRSIDID
jgi:HSP20 family protein